MTVTMIVGYCYKYDTNCSQPATRRIATPMELGAAALLQASLVAPHAYDIQAGCSLLQ